MAVPQAKRLLEAAKNGQTLTVEERRHVIAYCMTTGEDAMTNTEYGELFGVSDRTIVNDKRAVREAVAENIKGVDPALILADIQMAFDRNMRDIEKSKAKAKLGTDVYLKHCVAAFKLQADYLHGLQELGVAPKNLGTLHVEKFSFEASVGLETTEKQRPVTLFGATDATPLLQDQVKQLTNGTQSAQEAPTAGASQDSLPQRS